MKHILWVSRHTPTPEQMTYLSKILEDDNIIIARHSHTVVRHKDLIKEYRTGKYDDLVVTLPTEMIGRICAAGIYPIRAVHEMIGCDPGSNMRNYRFLRFERVYSVTVESKYLSGDES